MKKYYVMTDWGIEEIEAQLVKIDDGRLIFCVVDADGARMVAAFSEWRGFLIAK